MSLDIFNPKISVVPAGLEGKTFLFYGSNSVGKTKQATRMSKPFYLGFEKGINAISGVPFEYINKWSDFKKLNKQLTGQQKDKARELYDTIIFDTVDVASNYCQSYVAGQHGAVDIASGNGGYGLWKNYEIEFWSEIDKLTSCGYTVVFIGHTAEDKKTGQTIPRGDIRSIGLVRDLVDITLYIESNGVDPETGDVVLSSGYVRETPEYFARSRFDLMPNVVEPFTAENLEKAVEIGVKREEENGGTTVSYEDFVANAKTDELDFEEIKQELRNVGNQYYEQDRLEEFTEAMKDTFGEGVQPVDLKEKQVEAMSILLEELKEKL